MKTVRVVATRGSRAALTALVEWHDGERPRRTLVPLTAVCDSADGAQVDAAALEAGVDQGADWARLISGSAQAVGTAAGRLADDLRRAGIWTADDLSANYGRAQRMFARAATEDLSRLRAAAKREG
jgi:hypothetical protein